MLRFWARLIGNNSIFWTQITILKLEKAIVHWPLSSSQTHLCSSLALCLYKSRPQLTVFSGFGEVSPREETGRQEEVKLWGRFLLPPWETGLLRLYDFAEPQRWLDSPSCLRHNSCWTKDRAPGQTYPMNSGLPMFRNVNCSCQQAQAVFPSCMAIGDLLPLRNSSLLINTWVVSIWLNDFWLVVIDGFGISFPSLSSTVVVLNLLYRHLLDVKVINFSH